MAQDAQRVAIVTGAPAESAPPRAAARRRRDGRRRARPGRRRLRGHRGRDHRRRRPRDRRRCRRQPGRPGGRPPWTRWPPSSGRPTVLVNNAGVIRDNLLFKMTEDDWDTVLGVHLRGAFLMSRAAQKHMVDQRFGRIVNLSSSSALGNRGQVNYSAAKAGMQGFTKTLAIELGPFGVTANAVAPGFIVTDMTAATAARVGMAFEDFQAAAATQIPVRRVGQPDDVAHVISFLASEGAGLRLRPGDLRGGRAAVLTGDGPDGSGPAPGTGARRAAPAGHATSCAGHDPAGMDRLDFLRARFDAGPGLGALPGRASAAWACRARCRRWWTPSSPRPARPTTTRSATSSAWAWPPRRSWRSAPTSRRPAGCGRCGPARRSGASCSASPAPGSDLAGLATRAVQGRRRAGLGGQRAEGVDVAGPPGPLGPAGRPHRPGRAQARRADLLRLRHDRRRASRSGRCGSSPARPSSTRCS